MNSKAVYQDKVVSVPISRVWHWLWVSPGTGCGYHLPLTLSRAQANLGCARSGEEKLRKCSCHVRPGKGFCRPACPKGELSSITSTHGGTESQNHYSWEGPSSPSSAG